MLSAQAGMTAAQKRAPHSCVIRSLSKQKKECLVTDSKSDPNGAGAFRVVATTLMVVMLSVGVLQLIGVARF